MKDLLLFSISLALLFSCAPQKDITKVVTEGNSERLLFVPNQSAITLNNGVIVTVKPISADSLDRYVSLLSGLSGKYNYTNISSQKVDYKLVYKAGELQDESMLNILSSVDNYCNSKNYPKNRTDKILSTIINAYSSPEEKNKILKTINTNPFYYDNKYLSVYEIKLFNSSQKPQIVNLSDFNFVSGNECFLPFSKENFKLLSPLNNSYSVLNRIYFPENLVIEPNDTVVKYISTHPLNYKNSFLKVYAQNKPIKFEVEYQNNKIEKVVNYYRLHLKNVTPGLFVAAFDSYTLEYFDIEGVDVLIPENKLNTAIDIVLFRKSHGASKAFFISIATDIKLSEHIEENAVLGSINVQALKALTY